MPNSQRDYSNAEWRVRADAYQRISMERRASGRKPLAPFEWVGIVLLILALSAIITTILIATQ